MKYVFLALSTLFITGCTHKVIKVKDIEYKNSFASSRGCGKNLKIAKEVAKVNLSSNIVSNVTSKWESRRVREEDTYYSTSKNISKIESSFLMISPKFLNHTIVRDTFKDDIHCIDAIIDKNSLRKYENIADKIYRDLYSIISKQNGKLDYIEKDKYASKITRHYRVEIEKYNKISNFINLLSGRDKRDIFTKERIKQIIDAKPYVNFKIQGEVLYGKNLKVIPVVRDESNTKIAWIVDGKTFNKEVLNLKFKTPGVYRVSLTAIDKSGYKNSITKVIDVKNRPPIALFEIIPDKQVFIQDEQIQFINKSYDIEGELVKYRWNIADSKFSNEKDMSISFNKVGNFNVVLKVYDKYNRVGSIYNSIRVEGKIYKKIDIGMTKSEMLRVLGSPQRVINLNITSKLNSFAHISESVISNFGLESRKAYLYNNYWLILEGKIVKCMVYKKDFKRRTCGWYMHQKPFALAKK